MTDIPFTQYLRPNGRQTEVNIDRPDEIAAKAQAIIERGHRFECEVLMSGHVSLTIFDPDKETDIDIEVVPNGPEVPRAIDRMVERTAARLAS